MPRILDSFGYGVDTQAGKINKLLSARFHSAEEVATKLDVSESRFHSQLTSLRRNTSARLTKGPGKVAEYRLAKV